VVTATLYQQAHLLLLELLLEPHLSIVIRLASVSLHVEFSDFFRLRNNSLQLFYFMAGVDRVYQVG